MTEEQAAFIRKELSRTPATFMTLSVAEIEAELDRRWARHLEEQGRGDSDAPADDDAQLQAPEEKEEEEEVCAAKPLAELHAAVVHTQAHAQRRSRDTHPPSCRLAALTHNNKGLSHMHTHTCTRLRVIACSLPCACHCFCCCASCVLLLCLCVLIGCACARVACARTG